MNPETVLTLYLDALQTGNYDEAMNLFSTNAVIVSPLYGRVKASHFYRDLFTDTTHSKIVPHNIFVSKDSKTGAAHFTYTWTLKDGTTATFECVDIIEFSEKGTIDQLTIIYDTSVIRKSFENMKK
ncbi:MAG: nuclear transport factor 2 family protein [Candidatus Methanofastidiosia archaeon]|jgi:hypothetical protein